MRFLLFIERHNEWWNDADAEKFLESLRCGAGEKSKIFAQKYKKVLGKTKMN